MRVTVCELSDNELSFINDWSKLKIHVKQYKPDLLLLPELPFCRWVAAEKQPGDDAKAESVKKHERWIAEIEQLPVNLVVYSKPVIDGNKFYNTAYAWQKGVGHHKIHTKKYFPEEEHFWEETWYSREEPNAFDLLEVEGVKIGVLLCTEMWFTDYARKYGKQGIDILLCPRATGLESSTQWIRCGQTLAVISGAYCLSSNKCGRGDNDFQWGGNGWIAKPANGNLVSVTSADEQFITREIDISKSRLAKTDYPLYVKD